ncbi:packaged DNA stabilization protein, partial [Alcanivorax sp. HI0033]
NNIGSWVFGDRLTSVLGILDDTVATQYGEIVEWLLYTPFLYLKQQSIDKLDIETIPGYTGSDDATVFVSLTYNGVTWGREWTELYGGPTDYNKRFEVRRLGYVEDYVGIKLRGATTSRMAFSRG